MTDETTTAARLERIRHDLQVERHARDALLRKRAPAAMTMEHDVEVRRLELEEAEAQRRLDYLRSPAWQEELRERAKQAEAVIGRVEVAHQERVDAAVALGAALESIERAAVQYEAASEALVEQVVASWRECRLSEWRPDSRAVDAEVAHMVLARLDVALRRFPAIRVNGDMFAGRYQVGEGASLDPGERAREGGESLLRQLRGLLVPASSGAVQ